MNDKTVSDLSDELVTSAATSYFKDPCTIVKGWKASASEVGFGRGDVFMVEIDASVRGTDKLISLIFKRLPFNEEHQDSHSVWYWRREAEVYADLLANNITLPKNIATPDCYKIFDGSEQIWLVLEHINEVNIEHFTYDDFVVSAQKIGEFNGYYAANVNEINKFSQWTSRDWIKNWGKLQDIDETWSTFCEDYETNEYVRRSSPLELVKTRLNLARQAKNLPDRYNTLPKTLCHLDFFHKNVLRGNKNQLVVIDWAFTGVEILGADLSCLVNFALVVPSSGTAGKEMQFERDILDAYITGLRHSDYHCDRELVYFGYFAATTVRWGKWIFGKWPYEDSTWPRIKAWSGVQTKNEHADLLHRSNQYMVSVMERALQYSETLAAAKING